MKNKTIATASLLIALITLFFGDNLCQQLTGYSVLDTFRPTPTNQPSLTPIQTCIVPHIEGLDQKAAELALSQLGLRIVRTTQFNTAIPANIVISQDPPSGTRLSPCQGDVVTVLSLGPTPTPAPLTTTNLINISGDWKGTLTQVSIGAPVEFRMFLTQKGNLVKGTSKIYAADMYAADAYATISLLGEISENGTFTFSETEVVESPKLRSTAWCIKSGKLLISTSLNNRLVMSGPWEAKCTYGSGQISLEQQR